MLRNWGGNKMNDFQKRKQDVLSKLDKSSKQSWDEKILKLCEKINKSDNYYTTSSCAGRVVIMIDKLKKEPGLFLKVYHDEISLKRLNDDLNKIGKGELIKFKQEPCILHVACDSLEDAQSLLDKAKLAGWKRSGIIASDKRFICELNGTEKLEFLIMNKGKLLVGNEFLELIVKRCNQNLKTSWEKIERLKELV